MLTTLTVDLMVSYILDSLNFKPAAFFDGFDDFWGFDGFNSLFDQGWRESLMMVLDDLGFD